MQGTCKLIIPVLLSLFLRASIHAQSRESLRLGPGDEIRIIVFDAPELTQETKVTDSGDIKLILGGEVHVGGETPIGAARAIEATLQRNNYILSPQVSVSISLYATQTVSVLGAVKKPSAYALDTPRSVIDVLAAAGGLSEDASRRILIRRKTSGEKVTYFLSEASDRALDDAPIVYPGDEVFVSVADRYYMIGDLNRPGAYANLTGRTKVTVLQVFALAGSTPPTAVPSKARLIRSKPDGTFTVLKLNLSAMQKGKKPDEPMEPDDILYIPFSYLRNIAVGIGSIVSAATSASVYKF